MSHRQLVVVFEATEEQGGSVVDALLQDGHYHVRGTTQDLASAEATRLAARGVEMVKAEANDVHILFDAFQNASVVFAATDFGALMTSMTVEAAQLAEFEQGRNLANAAASAPRLNHFVWSTMPSASRISQDKYHVSQFEAKAAVDEYIFSNLPHLALKTTFLWAASHVASFSYPLIQPTHGSPFGRSVRMQQLQGSTPVPFIGDTTNDVGAYVSAIIANPHITTPAQYVLIETDWQTIEYVMNVLSTSTGREAMFLRTSIAQYKHLFGLWGQMMGEMMRFWTEFGERSWSKYGPDVITGKQLGIVEGDFLAAPNAFAQMTLDT